MRTWPPGMYYRTKSHTHTPQAAFKDRTKKLRVSPRESAMTSCQV